MPLVTQCESNHPLAVLDTQWSRPESPVYTKTTHVGLVISKREANYSDDSDFYATVWNPAINAPEEVQYATTRGWTYANGAVVDATPEVRAAYEVWRLRQAYVAQLREDLELAKSPAKGKTCVVVKGRKIAKGQTVACLSEPKVSYFKRTETTSILVKLADNTMVHTNVKNLEVQGHGQYLHTDAENKDRAARRLSTYGNSSFWTASEGKLLARAMAR